MSAYLDPDAAFDDANEVEIRLHRIEQRANAATEGPWEWFGEYDHHQVYLSSVDRGREVVMSFDRWGMRGAAPEFAVDRMLTHAKELVRFEVAPEATSRKDKGVYRGTIRGVRHPDAEFIAHAREDVPWLLEQLREARQQIDYLGNAVTLLQLGPEHLLRVIADRAPEGEVSR